MNSRFFASLFAAIGLLSAVTLSAAAAEAPVPAPEARGFYRTMVGDIEVTVLSDGIMLRPVEQLVQMLYGDKEKIKDELMLTYPEGQVRFTVNAFLIRTGSRLVLIDAGFGKMGAPGTGKVIDNLRAAGFQPGQIDEVYLTHMHIDHIGGLVAGTERAFPNATVYADQREADFWLSESNRQAELERGFQAVQTALAPYISAGRFKTFDGDTCLLPGIKSRALYGHTPGHTAYVIESKGRTLILWGDVVHVGAVQFADPSVTIAYDLDGTAAAKTRQQILAEAEKNGWLIGGAHLLLPSIGQVRRSGDSGYCFQPLGSTASE